MVDWITPLPGTVTQGDSGHVEDHNSIVEAISEVRDAVDGNESAVAGKANASHTHTIANVTGLQDAIDGKAAATHTHTVAQITGLQAVLTALEDRLAALEPDA